jgi:hypothetical protein
MAARYVNPDNVTAQGQYFYTGLLPGSYDTAGAGGGNVYGAGSGGSAGVSADRTGSDSSKTWAYQSNWNMNLGKTNWKDPSKRRKPEGGIIDDPPESPPPIDPGKRRKPVSNGGPQEVGGLGMPMTSEQGAEEQGEINRRNERNKADRARTARRNAEKDAEIEKTGAPRTFQVHHDDGGDGVGFRPGIDRTVDITGPKSITQQGPGGGLATGSGTVHQAGSPLSTAAAKTAAARDQSRPRTF